MTVAAAIADLAPGSLHLMTGRLRLLDVIPRSGWLSFGSGVSVAYACMRIMPELAAHQRRLEAAALPRRGRLRPSGAARTPSTSSPQRSPCRPRWHRGESGVQTNQVVSMSRWVLLLLFLCLVAAVYLIEAGRLVDLDEVASSGPFVLFLGVLSLVLLLVLVAGNPRPR